MALEREILVRIRYLEDSLGLLSAANNIKSFASQTVTTMGTVGSGFESGVVGVLKSGAGVIGDVVGGIKDKITDLAEHFKWASLFIGGALSAIVANVISTAAEFERFRSAATYLAGGTEAADKFAIAMTGVAKATMFNADQVAELGSRILGVTKDVGLSERAMYALTNAVTATGGGFGELEGAVRAFLQVNSKATLSSEELNRQFANQNIPVIRVLAESIVNDLNNPLRKYIETAGESGATGATKTMTKAFQSASEQLPILAKRSEAAEMRLKTLKDQGKENTAAFKSAEATVMSYHQKLDKAQGSISAYTSAQGTAAKATTHTKLTIEGVMAALQDVGDLKIPGNIAGPAILKALEEAYGGASQAMVNSFSFQFSRLHDLLVLTGNSVMGLDEKWQTHAGILSGLTTIIKAVNDFLDANQQKIQEWGTALGTNFGFITGALAALGATFVGFIAGVAGPVIVAALEIGAVFGGLGLIIGTLAQKFIDWSPLMEDAAQNKLPGVAGATDDAAQAMCRYNTAIMSSWADMKKLMDREAERKLLTDQLKITTDALGHSFDGLTQAFAPLGQATDDFKIKLSDIVLVMFGFIKGLSLFPMLAGQVVTGVLAILNAVGLLTAKLQGNQAEFDAHMANLAQLQQRSATIFNTWVTDFDTMAMRMANISTTTGTTIATNFCSSLNTQLPVIDSTFAQIPASFAANYSKMETKISTDAPQLYTPLATATKNYSSLYQTEFGHMSEATDKCMSAVESTMNSSFSRMSSTARTKGQEVAGNWYDGLIEGAKNLVGWAKDQFKAMTGLSFQHGGIVPGAIGQPVPILAHGGERVVPRTGVEAGGVSGNLAINFYGDISMDSEARVQELADKIGRILGRQNELARYSAGY